MKSKTRLFQRPGGRKTRAKVATALLIPVILSTAAAGALVQSRSGPVASYGPGQPLTWQDPAKVPTWAREVISEYVLEADYQIQIALADLNRDQQLEVLIAPAASRYDVFVPDSPLRLLIQQSGEWHFSESDVTCRPNQYGSFVTLDYWDLPCRSGGKQVLLRWNGRHYSL